MSKKWLLSTNSLEDAMFIWKLLVIEITFQIENIFAAVSVYIRKLSWSAHLLRCLNDWFKRPQEMLLIKTQLKYYLFGIFLPGDCYYGVSMLFDYYDFTLLVNVLCKLQFADTD